MMTTRGYAANDAKSQLAAFSFERREVGNHDVLIEISHCGVCHSDIHQVRNEWGGSIFPMVPGHEIVGRVTKVGSLVTHFRVGDLAGVGCLVDSCRECPNCLAKEEQYCDHHLVATYNSLEKDMKTPTYGGYSSQIVVDQNYALRLPSTLSLDKTAPLLCAGITTYSPLRHVGLSRSHRLAVVGLGGLGHMAVKFGNAFGAEVSVLSTSKAKEEDAKRLGAHHFVVTRDEGALAKLANSFDFILDSVSAPHNINQYLNLLKTNGTLVIVGVPEKPFNTHAFSLIAKRRKLMGSAIGGIKETQEMLDFCGQKNIASEIEVIPIQDINGAYERMIRGDVRYRFVIDMKSL